MIRTNRWPQISGDSPLNPCGMRQAKVVIVVYVVHIVERQTTTGTTNDNRDNSCEILK